MEAKAKGKQITGFARLLNRLHLKLRPKLILIFLVVKVIPIIFLTVLAWYQIQNLGHILRSIAVEDSTNALNDSARENIERMTTDTAEAIASFLRQRDQDILLLANLEPSEANYRAFSQNRNSALMQGEWTLAEDGMSWVEVESVITLKTMDISTNSENNDILHGSGFNSRPSSLFDHFRRLVPLYDEVTFIDLNGQEIIKYVNPDSPKTHYPLNPQMQNVSDKSYTYVKAEGYFEELRKLAPGEIYVSDVIGAYVGTNYIGMYTPG
ncbi:MAG: hypothetical protein FWE76_06880, partial [Symbiobacteriaceae bacterium]|nr:hypothetical protein [Symbiobacteriaceae bacterium]